MVCTELANSIASYAQFVVWHDESDPKGVGIAKYLYGWHEIRDGRINNNVEVDMSKKRYRKGVESGGICLASMTHSKTREGQGFIGGQTSI